MKVVINKCFGGFGLSPEAIKMFLKRKGKKSYFYRQTKYKHIDGKEEYKRMDDIKKINKFLFIDVVTKDLGKITQDVCPPNNDFYFSEYNIERTDKDLVTVVEKLGEEADGACAKLVVVNIPDNIKWFIDEYDGIETVHEKHKSW